MRIRTAFVTLVLSALALPALAAPSAAELATAYVVCDDRQGSGAFTRLEGGGYVLTVGHVALDPATGTPAKECHVGFVSDDSLQPKAFYEATIIRAAFDVRLDRDIAVLKLGARLGPGPNALPSAPARTSEFAVAGDAVVVRGFPGLPSGASAQEGGMTTMQSATGTILGFSRGSIRSNAPISKGYSGGPMFDAAGNLVGVAERVIYEIDEAGAERVVDYEFADILAVMGWLDSFGPAEHDAYLTHADYARFHGAPFVIRTEDPGCVHLVRTAAAPTVYCLRSGPYRLVFPNEATFRSWYPDYSSVKLITPENAAEYRLVGNMTMRAGSLVKIQTDPRVYLVTDSVGTLRWIKTEERARQLFGDGWASLVRDVPDAFFVDYRIGEPVE